MKDFEKTWDLFVHQLVPNFDKTKAVAFCGVCGELIKKGQSIVRVNNIGNCHEECSPGHFKRNANEII